MEQRAAIVTGGSRGIGRAVVEALLERGWKVSFCARSPEGVEACYRQLFVRFPGRVWGQTCDVRKEEAVKAFFEMAVGEMGRLDLLVSNAGVGYFAPVDEMPSERFREVVETNLFGAFYCLRAAVPYLKRQGSGWIVHIASLAAKNPFAGGAAYNASKFGLLGFSEAAMLDLRHYGVRVAAICPGSVATEFTPGGGEATWKLAPEDVARAVLDLVEFPERALPSLIELRPTRPPKR
jgi:NAD(P)-dependent dehydrogenase (short-subunit alcohol dehydrogenase family)